MANRLENDVCSSTRRLGLWEEEMAISQEQSGMSNVASQILITSKVELSKNQVENSLQLIMQRHPLLRSAIVKRHHVRYFDVCSDLTPVIRYSDASDGRNVMEEELSGRFTNGRQPLWRVVCLTPKLVNNVWSYTFVFVFHHAMVDGHSILQIYTDFLTYLEMASHEITPVVTSLPLKPARDEIFKKEWASNRVQKLSAIAGYLMNDFVSPTLCENGLISKMIRRFRPEVPTRRSRCVQLIFNNEETSSIVSKCHTHNLRVNGFCSAIMAKALRKLLLEYDIIHTNDVVNFKTECYVDLRKFSQDLNEEDLGLYMTHISCPVTLSPGKDSVWTEAVEFDHYLHDQIDSRKMFHEFRVFQAALHGLGPDKVAKVVSMTDHRSMPYYISNLGNIDLQPQVDLPHNCRFEEMHQTIGEHMVLVDGSVFINSIVTVNGRLFWTLGYHTHQVCDQVADNLASVIRDLAIESLHDQ